mgnify:CR=1 FL=1
MYTGGAVAFTAATAGVAAAGTFGTAVGALEDAAGTAEGAAGMLGCALTPAATVEPFIGPGTVLLTTPAHASKQSCMVSNLFSLPLQPPHTNSMQDFCFTS